MVPIQNIGLPLVTLDENQNPFLLLNGNQFKLAAGRNQVDDEILTFENEVEDIYGEMRMQALRSSSNWSTGRKTTESSIHECYLEAIDNADRFIYIENQFIISSTSSESGVENKIIKAIFFRIKRAFTEKEPFKVIIFLPLLPAFEASLEEQQGKVMQIQVGLENQTIGIGEYSLYGKLKTLLQGSGIDPEYYLMVCALRTWEFRPSDKQPITELIYIHSKVDLP